MPENKRNKINLKVQLDAEDAQKDLDVLCQKAEHLCELLKEANSLRCELACEIKMLN